MTLKKVICELTKENDTQLLKEVMGMTILHGAILYGRPGVVFSTPILRRSTNQHPDKIQLISMSYNGHSFNYDKLRSEIEKAKNETLLVYRDGSGKLISPLYIGKQFEENLFTRVIWTDKLGSRDYYKRNSWKELQPNENINKFLPEKI